MDAISPHSLSRDIDFNRFHNPLVSFIVRGVSCCTSSSLREFKA